VETYVVRGIVVDSESGDAIGGVQIDVRLMKEGEFIGFQIGSTSSQMSLRTPVALVFLTNPYGSFAISMTNGDRVKNFLCAAPSPNADEKPIPDQIRVIVWRENCRPEQFLDVAEDTVVDLSFPDGVIELKDPILVPPCEE